MTNDDLISIGFKPFPYPTIGNVVIYHIGRDRHLSAGGVGTPNEVIFICSTDHDNPTNITDLVCIHNYDYDGYLTEAKIKALVELLDYKKKDDCIQTSEATEGR